MPEKENAGTERISFAEFERMLDDIDVPDAEIGKYLKVNEDQSGPFNPEIEVNWDTIDDEGLEGAVLVVALNSISRKRRERRYKRKIKDGFNGKKVVSEGDSWFQYPFILDDVIDHLSSQPNIAIRSLGAAGDLLIDMVDKNEYSAVISEENPDVFLISGGGNDLVGDERLATMVHPFEEGRDPVDYPNAEFERFLGDITSVYQRLFQNLADDFSSLRILCHGYDFVIPDHGKWLGKPMEKIGITDREFQRKIVKVIMNRFNDQLDLVSQVFPNVSYINCRGVVSDWHDELHPKNVGYGKVANLFAINI